MQNHVFSDPGFLFTFVRYLFSESLWSINELHGKAYLGPSLVHIHGPPKGSLSPAFILQDISALKRDVLYMSNP